MTNASDQSAPGGLCQRLQSGIAHIPFGARHADLDEFMVMQRALGFRHNGGGHARISHQNDRFERVGKATQVPSLLVIEFHAPIVRGSGRS